MQDEDLAVRRKLDVVLDGIGAFLIGTDGGFECILRIIGGVTSVTDDLRDAQ